MGVLSATTYVRHSRLTSSPKPPQIPAVQFDYDYSDYEEEDWDWEDYDDSWDWEARFSIPTHD